MRLRLLCFVIALGLAAISSGDAFALRSATPLAADSRIRVINYQENEVYKFVGHYGYQSSIEFEAEEEVKTISIGDSTSWQIVPSGNRIFIKPIERDATTNMTVITDKRVYQFELHAQEAKDIRDDNMVFVMKFMYPGSASSIMDLPSTALDIPDLSDPEKQYNLNYTLRGSDIIAPIKIFDDGVFTFFQFRKHAEVPAFYIVRGDNSEEVVNYRVVGDYIVVERIASRFTLRSGNDIVCVYNESPPFSKAPPVKLSK